METERAHVMDAFVLEGEDNDEDAQGDAAQSRTTAPTRRRGQAREPPPMLSQSLVPLSQESAELNSWELLQEAWVQRRQAAKDEHERLAPDLAQRLRRTYDRLAVQRGWPLLPQGAALPERITASADWFFEMKSPFQNALKERRGEAVTRALTQKLQRRRGKCWACQGEAARNPRDADSACALHKALTAVDEVQLEMALRTAWAEEALAYAVSAWRQGAAAAERERLASLAREEEERGRNAVEQRARQMLRPKASKCAACVEADFIVGGLCCAHQEELEMLCEGLRASGPPLASPAQRSQHI